MRHCLEHITPDHPLERTYLGNPDKLRKARYATWKCISLCPCQVTKSGNGNQYVLVIFDRFTKWLEIYPLPDQSAGLWQKLHLTGPYHGLAALWKFTRIRAVILMTVFRALCLLLQNITVPTEHECLSYHRVILQMIRCYHTADHQRHWDQHLQTITGAIRATKNRTISYTPNIFMLGREATQPLGLLLVTVNVHSERKGPSEYLCAGIGCANLKQERSGTTTSNFSTARKKWATL